MKTEIFNVTTILYSDPGYTKITFPALVHIDLAKIVCRYGIAEQCQVGKNSRKGIPGCGNPVSWVRVWIPTNTNYSKATNIKGRGSVYCDTHGRKAAKKDGLHLLSTQQEYTAYRSAVMALNDQLLAERVEREKTAFLESQRKEQERIVNILKRDGRILRMSGTQGRLYEYADGSYKAEMKDGTIVDICCWFNGMHVIKNLHRGYVNVPLHKEDCIYSHQ